MKQRLLALFLLLSAISLAQSFKTDDLLGQWLTGSGKAGVTIYKEGTKYYGKITWLKNPNDSLGKPKVDKNNPDVKKRTVPLLGLNLLKDFTFDGEEKWIDGTIYDPENGKTYSCKITMISKEQLDVRGFVGISLLGRTQTWWRMK